MNFWKSVTQHYLNQSKEGEQNTRKKIRKNSLRDDWRLNTPSQKQINNYLDQLKLFDEEF